MKVVQPLGIRRRLVLYALLGGVAPGILFIFFILFGSDSYQYWADRYHTTLTSIYIFTRLPSETLLGPLWRDDTLAGNPWIISTATSPLALDTLLGRALHLSPFGIEMVGDFMLYGVAVMSMYVYLSRSLAISLEAAATGAVAFAATLYWDSILNTNPIVPMPAAWLPALLAAAHRVDTEDGSCSLLPGTGIALLLWGCAIHSNPATLPLALLLVVAYVMAVFGLGWTAFRVGVALAVGLLLYSPFLWLYIEAGQIARKAVVVAASHRMEYWLVQGKVMLAQLGFGLNRYGLYLAVMLVLGIWFCLGRPWNGTQARTRRVVRFAAGVSAAIFMIELFHEPINAVKRGIPLLGGLNALRFADFAGFGVATLFAWMLDRTVLNVESLDPSPSRRKALRWIVAAAGTVGALQIAHAAYRLRDVPATIFPQNVVLYAELACYALVLCALLVVLYRWAGNPSSGLPFLGIEARRVGIAGLMILSTVLFTSVHAYRSGLVKPQGIAVPEDAARIMSYKQRYAVPDEVTAIQGLYLGDGRLLDLTRLLNNSTWMTGSESTVFPLAGIRVRSAYTNLRPAWYELLIHTGINGRSGRSWNIVQVEDDSRTNFALLPFLDVEYVLARPGAVLPGYRPVPQFSSEGKMLYQVRDEARLGPAFVSPGVRCFATDNEALQAIHDATLSEVRTRAILVAGDSVAAPLCAKPEGSVGEEQAGPSLIRVQRGQDRVRLEVEQSPGGVLTLSDSYYPGWKVLVNGREQPVLRTYTALRGVMIGPGRQSIEFVYAPAMFARLLTLSFVGLAGLLLLSGVLWLRDRTRYSPSSGGAARPSLTGSEGI